MAETPQETAHFMDYWRMIKSRKEVVISVFLFVVLAGVVITLSLPKVYMASTRIAVRQEITVTPFKQQQQQQVMSLYDMYFLRTQFEIIQSRPILYEVMRNLRLQEEFCKEDNPEGEQYPDKDTIVADRL